MNNKPLERTFKKIDPEKLKEYIKNNPDAYLKETAKVFKCSDTTVRKALKGLGIMRKKRQKIIKIKILKK